MKTQDTINSPAGMLSVYTISAILPPAAGYQLAKIIARRIARKKEIPMVQAIRSNQWVASGCNASPSDLDRMTERVLVNHGCSLYEYFNAYRHPSRVDKLVTLDDKFKEVIKVSQSGTSAQLLLMPHYSNFDLAAVAAANHGLTMQVLSFPNPGRNYRWQNSLRNIRGLEVTPISISSLRQALKRLENKGTVFTGIDRPNPENNLHPVFFSRESALPSGYIRLALRSGVSPRVILVRPEINRKISLSVSDPVDLVSDPDPVREQLRNIENVLTIIQQQITADPGYWSMFYPVWPDMLSETP